MSYADEEAVDPGELPVARVTRGWRQGKEVRTEIISLRMTRSSRLEVNELARKERRNETDMLRMLIGEALAERARTKRR